MRKTVCFVVQLCLLPLIATGAVAINGSTAAGNLNTARTSYSFSYTTPAGTTALVITENNVGGPSATPTSITYNGVELTMVPGSSVINPNASYCESSIWYLILPSTGTSYSVVISYGTTVGGYAAGATPLTGVNQISPVGAAATASGAYTSPSNPAVTASGGASGDLYIGTTYAGSSVTSTGSSTELWNTSAMSPPTPAAGDSIPGSAAGAFTWTQSDTANDWTASAVAFKAAAGSSVAIQGGFALSPSN